MSRVQLFSKPGWFVAGVVAAFVLVPTATVAATLSYVGIQGTSGNHANVSASGQVLVAPADAKSYVLAETFLTASGGHQQCFVLAAPASGQALVLENVHYSAADVDTPYTVSSGAASGATQIDSAEAVLVIEPKGTPCNYGSGYAQVGWATFSQVGNADDSFDPGVTVPNGYQVSVEASNVGVAATLTGYHVASTAVNATPQSPVKGAARAFANPRLPQHR